MRGVGVDTRVPNHAQCIGAQLDRERQYLEGKGLGEAERDSLGDCQDVVVSQTTWSAVMKYGSACDGPRKTALPQNIINVAPRSTSPL
jgi:hypothetical protein